ncbi:MAG: hypothetical protein ACRC3G_01620, partial [Bacteroidales bacterium]
MKKNICNLKTAFCVLIMGTAVLTNCTKEDKLNSKPADDEIFIENVELPPATQEFFEGEELTIVGTGFLVGDKIILRGQGSRLVTEQSIQENDVEAIIVRITKDSITITIPPSISSTVNQIILVRGDSEQILGSITIVVTPTNPILIDSIQMPQDTFFITSDTIYHHRHVSILGIGFTLRDRIELRSYTNGSSPISITDVNIYIVSVGLDSVSFPIPESLPTDKYSVVVKRYNVEQVLGDIVVENHLLVHQVSMPADTFLANDRVSISAEGFVQGDKVVLRSSSLQQSEITPTMNQLTAQNISFTLPSNVIATSYAVVLQRGSEEQRLGYISVALVKNTYIQSGTFTVGSVVSISGIGFTSGDKISLSRYSSSEVNAEVGQVSNNQLSFTVPANVSIGTNEVTIRRGDSKQTLGTIQVKQIITIDSFPPVSIFELISYQGLSSDELRIQMAEKNYYTYDYNLSRQYYTTSNQGRDNRGYRFFLTVDSPLDTMMKVDSAGYNQSTPDWSNA